MRVESGYIDLQVEFVGEDRVLANILTDLPEEFALKTGESIEVFQEEILYKVEQE